VSAGAGSMTALITPSLMPNSLSVSSLLITLLSREGKGQQQRQTLPNINFLGLP
jgi:hypothetical protein